LEIHLVGNLRLANAFRPHLKTSKGRLINMGSMYSYCGAPGVPAYGAAKTGVVSLTKSLDISFAEDGIRVNAIAPGWIKPEMTRAVRENLSTRSSTTKSLLGFPAVLPNRITAPIS
jgi:NAD(P)-dependent dehydrogenase (short-subunit alcohol dehydrogenase family)